MFERKIFQEMLKWKEQYAPHYALFLKGAERVGKTTLAEKLGREAYESYILIRFDQADQVVKDLFVTGLRVKRLHVCAQNAGYLSHPSKKINYQLKACFSWLL